MNYVQMAGIARAWARRACSSIGCTFLALMASTHARYTQMAGRAKVYAQQAWHAASRVFISLTPALINSATRIKIVCRRLRMTEVLFLRHLMQPTITTPPMLSNFPHAILQMRCAFTELSKPVKATFLMLLAMILFVSMGIFIKLASAEMHTLQVVFFRNFFALVFLSPLILRHGFDLLLSQNMGLYWLRSVMNVVGMATGFAALMLIPLAEATALGFTAPLFATLGAILLLGETIRIYRMTAIAIGFLGVMIVIGPNLGGLSLGAALALTNAVILAITALIVKRLTSTDSVEAIIIWMVLLSTPIALVPALFVWTWPDGITLFWLVCLGVTGTLGHFCWTSACSIAEITQLQPLEFVRLPLMAIAGFVLFSETPQFAVWIGGALIFISAVYITRREAQIARAERNMENNTDH